jgi:hypothetical protein
MECPFNIKVVISEQFFTFPYEYVVAQTDIGRELVKNLIVYVPTEEDKEYVDVSKLKSFNSVLVVRHENDESVESRAPKKNGTVTVVYWNPILPITEIGAGETRVFSVLLTNDLFYCNTMILDHKSPICPIEFNSKIEYKNLKPIAGETPLYHLKELLDENVNNFLICFNRETSTIIKILNIKRILSIFEFRKRNPARYLIYLPDAEVDSIYNKLMWERTRRLMKGDIPSSCVYVNKQNLHYIKLSQEMLGIKQHSQSVVDFVELFQSLILPYRIVPDAIIKLNSLVQRPKQHVRVYCKNDSVAITSYGSVPNNLQDDNPVSFDYTDINNNKHLYRIRSQLMSVSDIDNLTVTAARYNYFL